MLIISLHLGVWTLIFGAVVGVEKFTIRKLLGVLASLVGIIMISGVDLSGGSDEDSRGSFPHKTPAEIALGDAMAAFSAIMYGIYTIVMKKRIGSESRVNMQLFFGLVGLFNTFLIWPGFILLHFTGVERFTLPPTDRIWMIIVVRSPIFKFLRNLHPFLTQPTNK
jgi:solute carrier family 35 protein F5